MARIPGGEFTMGSDEHYPEEAPAHRVSVDGFRMDATAVTNAEFGAFVEETGYLTVAERPLDPADFPGAPPENLVPGSLVFTPTPGPVDLRHMSQWWTWTPGACWKHPEGPDSSLAGRENHPVVHVAYEDAQAYAGWAGKALPTEAQWELAARAGLDGATLHLGRRSRGGRAEAGQLLARRLPLASGVRAMGRRLPWARTRPTASASSTWPETSGSGPPTGTAPPPPSLLPAASRSYDPTQPQFRVPRKVIKGGSFLCADSYCLRYRPAARRPQMVDTGMSHVGFRCVRSA